MFSDHFDEYEKTSCTESDGSYSDQINSDVEAELYGLIHHEQNEEFSFQSPDMKMLNAEDNANHKELQPSVSKHGSFAANDGSFLKHFKSFETTSKSYFSTPQSLHDVSSENSFSERLENSTSNHFSFSDTNKRKRDSFDVDEKKNQKKSFVPSKNPVSLTNNKIRLDSSDSDDSIIILEPSKDFTTNLSSAHDTVELSSDDSSDTDFFSSRLNFVGSNLNSTRSKASPSMNNNKNIPDPWHITNEDLYRTGRHSKSFNRYHNKMLQKCTNCNESGHVARSCTVPQQVKCFLCGGPHMASCCEKTICSKCYKKGHNSRRCWRVRGTQSCTLCNMYGHEKMNCPDIWRRYHLTTSNSRFIKGHRLKQDVPLYCFNCGVKGHFGSECPRPRMQTFESIYPTWPVVVSYKDQEKILRKERENSGGWRDKQHNSPQKQSRSKQYERSRNENINHKHHSNLVNERTPVANAKQESKHKLKKGLTLQSAQKPVKESNFPRSPRQNISTIIDERLKKIQHLPSSSKTSPLDDLPLSAQKKTLKNRERRRQRRAKLMKFKEMNKRREQLIH